MFGIHMTEGNPGRAMVSMGTYGSYGAFCPNAIPSGQIGILQPGTHMLGTFPRLKTGTGTCVLDVGVGPQVAVRMPAGA